MSQFASLGLQDLPLFFAAGSAHQGLAFVLLGLVFVVQGLLFLFGVVALSLRLRRLGTSPRAVRVLHAIGGALFAGLALRLAAGARPGA
jgi:threonine/homoserine/homoserine lactone efflux protein